MLKHLILASIALLAALPCCAADWHPKQYGQQETPRAGRWLWVASASAHAGGIAVDWQSHLALRRAGYRELSPLIRGRDGHLSTTKYLMFNGAIFTGVQIVRWRLGSKSRPVRWACGMIDIGSGAGHGAAAIHNWRLPR